MFDYRVLATCQYGIVNDHNDVSDCGEPATHEVWWGSRESDKLLVCQEHFDFIQETELSNDAPLGEATP